MTEEIYNYVSLACRRERLSCYLGPATRWRVQNKVWRKVHCGEELVIRGDSRDNFGLGIAWAFDKGRHNIMKDDLLRSPKRIESFESFKRKICQATKVGPSVG
jgi:hypothetical protein